MPKKESACATNATRETVLSILKQNAGEFCSGEQISRSLGLSRTAVSKTVAQLRREGYEISSVTNRGYRLEHSPDRLTEGTIRPWLHSGGLGETLLCYECIDSTNNLLKRMALEGAPGGTVVVADSQSAGRGRLGRAFQSPPNTGIYLSLLLRPQVRPDRAVTLTASTAVAMCDAIEAACGVRTQIKWTTDIVLGGKKLCGILTEMAVEGETGALQHIVVGIGINVNQTQSDFPEELQPIAGSLAMALGHPCDRGRLTAEILNALSRMLEDWEAGVSWVARYRADCATLGREIRILRRGSTLCGVAEDVDGEFGLMVRYGDGTRETIVSGEVSVRGLEGHV